MKNKFRTSFNIFSRLWLALILSLSGPAFAENVLNITDAAVLDKLSEANFSLGAQLGQVGRDAETLNKSRIYGSLVSQIEDELGRQEEVILRNAPNPEYIERFKISWLRSPRLSFELSAVVNRFDRRNLDTTPCGEIRLIYRPKYRTFSKDSTFERLPMTVMLVYSALDAMKESSCRDIAREMLLPTDLNAHNFAKYYIQNNRLGSSLFSKILSFIRVEINIQVSRWPATRNVRFSDQSHYLMRAFVPDSSKSALLSIPLENSPDVNRLQSNPSELRELKNWLLLPTSKELVKSGSIQIPKRFLKIKEVSVSPLGMARLANRPFSALFSADESFSVAYLRRLDSLSCGGCHQSKSLAGFHALGIDSSMKNEELTIRWPFSAYFEGIQAWRLQDLAAAVRGMRSQDFPSPERSGLGSSGDTCSLDEGFVDWGCQSGFKCDFSHSGEADTRFGQCITVDSEIVGSPCDTAHIDTKIFSIRDEYVNSSLKQCGENSICAPSLAGFPNGFCTTSCKANGINLCTPVPSLGPFSKCLETTHEFRSCARQFNYVVDMPRCRTNLQCRRDYACIASKSGEGFCAPPYFVPELTLGHHQL
jgi:hypothetical protein